MARKIILDPDGDVCLRLQERHQDKPQHGQNTQRRSDTGNSKATLDLIVSSTTLATASPVFESMFHGKFKEGAEFAARKASSTLYVQELPEDNAEATITLCALLHFNDEHALENLTPMAMVTLTDLARKYLCLRIIHFPCRFWLKHQLEVLTMLDEDEDSDSEEVASCENETVTRSLCQCLYVSYILDIPQEYAAFSNVLVQTHVGTSKHSRSLTAYLGDLDFQHGIRGNYTSLPHVRISECLLTTY